MADVPKEVEEAMSEQVSIHDQLEAAARARGITVEELLAELAPPKGETEGKTKGREDDD